MRDFMAEKARLVARLVQRGAVYVVAAVIVASVGVLTLSHTELFTRAGIADSESSGTAMVLREAANIARENGAIPEIDGRDSGAEPGSPTTDGSGTAGESVEAAANTADSERPIAVAWAAEVLGRVARKTAEYYAERFDISLALARDIHRIALDERIDPDIAFGLVRTESSFRPHVVSWAGAVGLTQLLPSTANWIVPGTHRSELFDVETNLRVGFTYLRHLLEKYGGNERLALLAYNRGPGTVDGILERGGDPSNGYAAKVLGD